MATSKEKPVRTIEQMWDQYFRMVILPTDPSAIQVKESKRCFFAGAQALQAIMIGDVAALPDEPAEDAMRKLDIEMHNFSIDIAKGKA